MPFEYTYFPLTGSFEIFDKGDSLRVLVRVDSQPLAEKITRGLNLVEQEDDDDRHARALR